MITLKPGVSLKGLQPQVVLAIMVAGAIYGETFKRDLVITSVNDGKHGRGSLHYKGLGVDLRVHNLPPGDSATKARDLIAEALGAEFDVLYEGHGTPNAHIHVEWDPK